MLSKNLYFALLTSLMLHSLFIGYFSINRIKKNLRPTKQIEVTYAALKPVSQKVIKKEFKKLNLLKEKEKIREVKIPSSSFKMNSNLQGDIKETSKLIDSFKINSKIGPENIAFAMDRKISIPMLKSDKITNPKYLGYNEHIRQKIRERAYTFSDSPDFDSGKVYLSFILMSDGKLRKIKIREDKTFANDFLREIGLKSIRQANPFPPFPHDLNYPELSFNVVISFEVNE